MLKINVAGSLQEAAEWGDSVQQPLPHHGQSGDQRTGGGQGELQGDQLQYKTAQYSQVGYPRPAPPFHSKMNPT